MANPRARKVADRIKEGRGERRLDKVRDPRLGFVTITDVQGDGRPAARLDLYTVYGTDQERADSATALTAATGCCASSKSGATSNTRLTPSLEFIPDGVPENAASIEALLREARERDEQTLSAAATAQYAGDPDPYVKPREWADDDEEGPRRRAGRDHRERESRL